MRRANDEFYVGYFPSAPQLVARFIRRVAGGLVVGVVAAAVVVATVQSRLEQATFEFGHPRSFTGTITTDPFPTLRMALPGTYAEGHGVTRIALVNRGKHGAGEAVAHHANHQVQLEGTLIYRDAETMLELVPGSVRHLGTAPQIPPRPPESLGTVTLRGEIVDAKCYLGVMNPGSTIVHRACAIRCLSGGIPPILALSESTGRSMVWLTAPRGQPLGKGIAPFVAEPVEVTGELLAYENHLVLEIDPATITRTR